LGDVDGYISPHLKHSVLSRFLGMDTVLEAANFLGGGAFLIAIYIIHL
jgi:hypothetical protein